MATRLTPQDLPEPLSYRLKRRLLGPPLITEQLSRQRLSKSVALGVLSPDCISSSAYGTEEMLIELLPVFGLAAFTLVLPITAVVLVILALMTLSYREVVSVYTRAGGSYVVARDNFGPRVAQVAAVALLIDYVVTVAVQAAAGTVAVVSAVPVLGPYSLEMTIGVVLIIAYGNLRGTREAGKIFAFPTYLFSGSMIIMIVVGVLRALLGGLPHYQPAALPGTVPVNHVSPIALGLVALTLLRSFANGGSSLTGLEAISNGVSAFRRPQGINARRVLVVMALILGFLVAGVSWLAYLTHATPYTSGYPSVISQEAQAVFGHGTPGRVFFFVVQAASALILYTGANTSFNGFPFLASFVAEDRFLPRQLTRRGHRLVFSNGIIVLTAVSVALLAATDAKVNSLVPFYAIGVFTGFTMAGLGMAKYHHTRREAGWRHKLVINASGGAMSALVVLIFAVAKFTEGAWLVVVLFPVFVVALIRLNREYRDEAAVLASHTADREPNYARHVVLVFVDTVDLATLEALRYGRSLRPVTLRAVHFMIDSARAERLQRQWAELEPTVGLDIIDCPDRRVTRAAAEFVVKETERPGTEATVLLPRRSYPPLLGRLLHDRTADKIARVLSRLPHTAATIIPFDTQARLHAARPTTGRARVAPVAPRPRRDSSITAHLEPHPPPDVTPIGTLADRQVADIQGRIRSIQVRPLARSFMLACDITDATGQVTALFYGRRQIPGIQPGTLIRLHGLTARSDGATTIANPAYRIIPTPENDNGEHASEA